MVLDVAKRINDNIYGNVDISAQELGLIDTPVFQRLHRIKQLGATDLVYPGATHTRFAHSVGTMHMISQFISAIRKHGGKAGDDDGEKLRIAALLHDIGHYPLSHTVENAVKRLGGKNHEEFGAYLLKRFLSEKLETYKPSEISDIFLGKSAGTSLLISSALDADKADYLVRDSYNAGVPYGRVSIQRLIRTISYVKNGIMFDKDEIAAEDFLIGRYHMYRSVYHHRTVTAFGLMAERIFENLVMEGFMPNPRDMFSGQDELAITSYTDDLLMSSMYKYLGAGKDKFLKWLIRSFLEREPLECVYLGQHPVQKGSVPKDVEKVRKIIESENEKAKLADAAGMDEQEIFAISMRPLSLIDEDTNIYIRSKGKVMPITESSGLVLNMVGSKTLYDARVYAMPGSGRKLGKAIESYMRKG